MTGTSVTVADLRTGDVVKKRFNRRTVTAMVGHVMPSRTGNSTQFELYSVPAPGDLLGVDYMHTASKVLRLDACHACTDGRECGVCGRAAR